MPVLRQIAPAFRKLEVAFFCFARSSLLGGVSTGAGAGPSGWVVFQSGRSDSVEGGGGARTVNPTTVASASNIRVILTSTGSRAGVWLDPQLRQLARQALGRVERMHPAAVGAQIRDQTAVGDPSHDNLVSRCSHAIPADSRVGSDEIAESERAIVRVQDAATGASCNRSPRPRRLQILIARLTRETSRASVETPVALEHRT